MQSKRALFDPGRVNAHRSETEGACFLAEGFDLNSRGFGFEKRVIDVARNFSCGSSRVAKPETDARSARLQRAGDVMWAALRRVVSLESVLRTQTSNDEVRYLFDEGVEILTHCLTGYRLSLDLTVV